MPHLTQYRSVRGRYFQRSDDQINKCLAFQ